MITQVLIGTSLGVIVGYLAWRFQALNRSGAWAAGAVGALVFGLGGFPWAILLLTFFISSSVLSRAFVRRKAALSEKFAKGSQRDWGQVLANGGLGACLAIFHAFYPENIWLWIAYSGAMAAVNADTWATELGVFSSSKPRMITSGKPVERGTSGGITFLGYLAALGGALLIGLVVLPFTSTTVDLMLLGVISLAGISGSTFDSFLGATVQGIYYCPQCKKETERYPVHTCGTDTSHNRGWTWLNNDIVNFACSLVGALVAAGLWQLLAY